MDPIELLEYLGYQHNKEVPGGIDLIYKTIDDYGRVRTGKFAFQYLSHTKTVSRFYSLEGVSLPIGQAEDIEEAIIVARTYLERTFTDLKFGIEEDKKFLRLWKEKCLESKRQRD